MSRILRHSTVVFYLLTLFAILAGCAPTGNLAASQPSDTPPGFVRIDSGGPYTYSDPVWSPDSSKIAYVRRERAGHTGEKPASAEIFVVDLANRETVQLTQNNIEESWPSWSPDGQQIVYARQDAAYDPQAQERVITDSLRIVASNGSNDRELYRCPASCGMPAWSPDEKRIAFSSSDWSTPGSTDSPPGQIDLINVDGTGLVRLTPDTSDPFEPRWSLDGRQIAFWDAKQNQIRLIDVQSKLETHFSLNNHKGGHSLSWSPDQTEMLFSAIDPQDGQRRLYLLHLADQTITPLFDPANPFPKDAIYPAWSPDGSKVAFVVYNHSIYVANLVELKLR